MGTFWNQVTTSRTLISSSCWSVLIVMLGIENRFWSALGGGQIVQFQCCLFALTAICWDIEMVGEMLGVGAELLDWYGRNCPQVFIYLPIPAKPWIKTHAHTQTNVILHIHKILLIFVTNSSVFNFVANTEINKKDLAHLSLF